MILKEVRIKNIRSYETEIVRFGEGSVLLSGDIGSGKSSVLLAVEFALFGIMPGVLSGESLLRHGKDSGEVELMFSVEGKEVVIHRELKRINKGVVQSAGFVVVNGMKQTGTTTELKAKVFELLGYPLEDLRKSKSLIYRYTVYTPQEQMKEIIQEEAEVRLSVLRKIFGIDKYKRVLENNVLVVRKLKRQKENYEVRSEGISELRSKLEEKLKEKVELEINFGNIDEKIKEIKEKLGGKKEELREIGGKIEKLNSLRAELKSNGALNNEKINVIDEKNKELERVKKEIEEFEKKIFSFSIDADDVESKLKEIEKQEKFFNDLNEEISALKIKKEKLNSFVNSNEIDKIDERLKGLVAEFEDLKEKQKEYFKLADEVENLKEFEENIEILKRDIADVDKEKVRFKLKIDAENEVLKRVIEQDKCPTCLQEISEGYKGEISREKNDAIKFYDAKLKGNEEKLMELSKELEGKIKIVSVLKIKKEKVNEIKGRISNVDKVEEEIEKLKNERDSMKIKLVGIKEEIEDLNEEIKKKEGVKLSLDESLDNIKKITEDLREIKNLKERITDRRKRSAELYDRISLLNDEQREIIEKIKRVKADIDKFKDISEQKEKIDSEIEELNNALKEKEISKNSLEERVKSVKEWINDYKGKILEKEESYKKAKKLGEMINWLDTKFVGVVSLIEKTVLSRIRFEFDSLLGEWFNMLVPDENLNIKIDESFSPVVIQNGYEVDVNDLSGGEKTAVALAYRLSLNKVINDVVSSIRTKDLIILDEPTDGFSSEQLDRVREVLDELGMKQVLIVSHENKIESFVDSVIGFEKSEGRSRVV